MGNWRYKRNVVSTINESFDQPSFIAYNKNLESVLANFLNDDQISSQIKFVKENVAELRHQVLLSSSPVGDIQGSDEGQTAMCTVFAYKPKFE